MAAPNDPNIYIIEAAVRRLGPLSADLVFLGGCATGLLVTDPAAPSIRATKDVDAIVEVTTLAAYHGFSQKLRERGFREDMSDGAPICRWQYESLILDVMPTDPTVLGFGNRWFETAFASSSTITLPSGEAIRIVPAPLFMATKLEAFDTRGKGDFLLSSDLEDVVSVLNGRPEIVEEVRESDQEVTVYLGRRFKGLISNQAFLDALPGHLPPDAASQARAGLILERIRQLADY